MFNIKKLRKMKKLKLAFVVIILILYGCNQSAQENSFEDDSNFSLTEEQTNFLNEMYYQFNQSPATHLPTIEDQIFRVARYVAVNNKQSVDLKDYSHLFNQENKVDPRYVDHLQNMLSIVSLYGFKSKSIEALNSYKSDVLSSERITKEEKFFLEVNVEVLSFMVSSPEVQNYYLKLNNSETFAQAKAQSPLGCALATVTYGLNFTLCLMHGIACESLSLKAINLVNQCQSEGYDPCANNPDPCCGVHCANGHECINGNCVYNPELDDCLDCPPGTFCHTDNGECIEY